MAARRFWRSSRSRWPRSTGVSCRRWKGSTFGWPSTEAPTRLPTRSPSTRMRRIGSYDPEYANRFWRVLVQASRVLNEFRARFIGKCSPVHFFWGAPDLAVTRFSGRRAPSASRRNSQPARLGHARRLLARSEQLRVLAGWRSDLLTRRSMRTPIRNRPGSREARVKPAEAFYSTDLQEFILAYDVVRQSTRRTRPCLIFCRRRMKPPPIWRLGIAMRWSVSIIRRARFRELGGGDEPQTGRG